MFPKDYFRPVSKSFHQLEYKGKRRYPLIHTQERRPFLSKTIRFIHSADLHLGSPLKTMGAMSKQLQQTLKEASFTAVERLVDSVLEHEADFVLLSGDIYDRDSRSVKANEFLAKQMERLHREDVPVCIIYGNHDPLGAASDFYKLPQNVKVFPWEAPDCLTIRDSHNLPVAKIYGQSYRNASDGRKMYANFLPSDSDTFNIGMLHTALSPGARTYVPCSLQDLRNIQHIHYWALGHIHHPRICSPANPAAAFPGIPQGRDWGEPSVGGCLLVEADTGGVPQIKFIPLSEVVWLKVEISISEDAPEDLPDLEEMIAVRVQEILSQGPGAFYPDIDTVNGPFQNIKGYVARLEITGRGRLHQVIQDQDVEELTATMENRLRQDLGTGNPFFWTESLRFKTAAPLPENMSELEEKDKIFRTLAQQRANMIKPEFSKEIHGALGNIWYLQKDPEDIREDSIPYNEEKLEELLDAAKNLVVDRIIRERENLDT